MRFNRGDYPAAIIQLKNALQREPASLPARILLARAHLEAGDAEAAQKELLIAKGMGADPALIAVPLARAYAHQQQYGKVLAHIKADPFTGRKRGEVLLRRGEAHLKLMELEEAEAAFAEAATLVGDPATALLGRVAVRMERGEYDAAKELLERASAADPNNPEVWYLRGEVDRLVGRTESAIGHYGRAVDLSPRHLVARNARAGLLLNAGRLEDAAADIAFVREHDAFDPRAAYLDALLKARRGDPKGAEAAMEDALRILNALPQEFIEGHRQSLLLAGVVHYALGNTDQAHDRLATYVRKYPRNARARRLLGAVLLQRDEPLGAIEVLEPVMSWTPDDPRLHLLMGRAHLQVEQFQQAERLLTRAAELAPDAATVRSQLAVSRLRLGRGDEAMDDLRAALELDPSRSGEGLILGKMQLANGRQAAALETAKALVEQDPDNPSHHNLLGAAQAATGDVEGARRAFEEALRRTPEFAPAALNLARLHRRLGDYAEASELYQALLTRDASDTRALEGLAEVAAAQGRVERALELLEKVRAIDMNTLPPQLRLADLYLQDGQPEAAAGVVRDLEVRFPENLGVLAAVGRVEMARGDREKALVTFRRMSKIAFYSTDQLKRIGVLQLQAQDLDGAYWTYLKAAEATPGDVGVQSALARIEVRQDKLEKARERAESLRASHPGSPVGNALLGELHMQAGRYQDAAAAFQAALAIAPAPDLVLGRQRALAAAGQVEEGIALLNSWLAKHPEDAAARLVLASSYSAAGRTGEAIAAYEAVRDVRGPDPLVLNNLASLYQQQGDPRARSMAEAAYQGAPENPAVLDTYGWILVQEGEPEAGLRLLREAYSRASRVAEVRYHLAAALAALGRDAEARPLLEALLAEGGGFAEREAAAALLERLGPP